MNIEKYLPAGTVVMLKGGKKRVMIIGFCSIVEKDTEKKVWDYSGCLYPEGVLNSSEACLFNHDQIEKIYHLGLIDQEEVNFKENLDKILEKINQKEEENKEESNTEIKEDVSEKEQINENVEDNN